VKHSSQKREGGTEGARRGGLLQGLLRAGKKYNLTCAAEYFFILHRVKTTGRGTDWLEEERSRVDRELRTRTESE